MKAYLKFLFSGYLLLSIWLTACGPIPGDTILVSGQVWVDENINAARESNEPGAGGIEVRLYTSSRELVATTLTDGVGAYFFGGQKRAGYIIQVIAPEEYGFTDKGGDSLAFGEGTDRGYTEIIDPLSSEEVNVGLVAIDTSVGDFVWHDENGDGFQGESEPGLPNIRVVLRRISDNFMRETTTDGQGKYLFLNVIDNQEYELHFYIPPDFVVTRRYLPEERLPSTYLGDSDCTLLEDAFLVQTLPFTPVLGGNRHWDCGVLKAATPQPEPPTPSPQPASPLTPAADGIGYYNQGVDLFRAGKLEDALLAFDEAIGLDPDLAAAYHYRAQIHYLQGDYEKAEADFAKAIELEPTQAEIYYNRGIMRFYRQDYANARVDFQAAIQRNADYGLAYYGLAIAEDALGNTQAAITAFEQARARAAQLPQGTRDYIESRLAALGSGGSAGFNVAGSYAHTQPGVQSEVYLSVTGTAGELVEATLNGPGVLGAAVQSGAIGADGKLTLTWAIDQTGNYTVSGTVGGKSFNVAVIVQ